MTKILSPIKRTGPALLAKGYPIVPIRRGFKYPEGISNWDAIVADQAALTRWTSNGFADGGVGILTKNLPAVDLDVRDPEIVDLLVAWCEANIGPTVQRVGAAPKVLLAYRATEPFAKIQSPVFVDMFGDEHKVEILGTGQQYVAYAVHPGTGREYDWGRKGLVDTRPQDLPLLTEAQAHALIAYFLSIVPADWVRKGPPSGSGAGTRSTDPLANAQPRVNISDARLAAALNRIDPDCGHDTWVSVGMGLHHQFGGSAAGFDLWDSWSAEGVKYEAAIMRGKWRSFEADLRNTNPVTARTILALAPPVPQAETSADPLDIFLDRYVFVEDGNLVCDLHKPPHHSVSRLDEFRNATANIRHEVPAPTEREPDRVKLAPVHNAWLVHPDRKTAQGVRYAPGREIFFEDEIGGLSWVNDFNTPQFPKTGGDTSLFREHMAYLMPDDVDRQWFVDWMAFNVQRPELRCKVTPLHVSVAHGTGRGWIVELMQRLLGPWNCTKTKMSVLSGEGSAGQYQDYLDRSLLCAVEEVREGAKRFGVSDRIRDVLTERWLEVNAKFGGKKTQQVYVNFFFMSNHPDALVLPEEDRRIYVIEGPRVARDDDYYTRLYEWAEGPGVAALHAELAARDLTKFNWQRAPMTPAKAAMIDSNRSVTEQLFWEMMAALPARAMTLRQIVGVMGGLHEDGPMLADIDEGQLTKLLQHHARKGKRIRLGGRESERVYPWIFDMQLVDDNEAIKAEVEKL